MHNTHRANSLFPCYVTRPIQADESWQIGKRAIITTFPVPQGMQQQRLDSGNWPQSLESVMPSMAGHMKNTSLSSLWAARAELTSTESSIRKKPHSNMNHVERYAYSLTQVVFFFFALFNKKQLFASVSKTFDWFVWTVLLNLSSHIQSWQHCYHENLSRRRRKQNFNTNTLVFVNDKQHILPCTFTDQRPQHS